MNKLALLATLVFSFALRDAHAFNVFACEPEWGSLVHELAGDKISA